MFSKYDVYTEFGSKYCYKNSSVLRNKLGIRDFETLKQAEADITALKQTYLLDHPVGGRFTSSHLCHIHRFLFEDVYRFAGHIRTEDIKKGETTFLSSKDISKKLLSLLVKLRQEHYLKNLSVEDFICRITYYFAELNYIHPFRDGNGRATREFVRELVQFNGYEVDWSKVYVTTLLESMVASIYDTADLERVLNICITKNQ
jgi:cell filamentation protein